MKALTKKLTYGITKIGNYIESEHIKYSKMFHLHNAKELNKLTLSQPVKGLEKNEVISRNNIDRNQNSKNPA